MSEYLTDIEELGLTILAMRRNGQLKQFNCSTCTEDLQKTRNCEGEDVEEPILPHPFLGNLYRCPIMMIPTSVISFIQRYDYYEKYPSKAPSYEEVNPRYWASVQFYENVKYEIMESKEEENKQEQTENNMSTMAGLFAKK